MKEELQTKIRSLQFQIESFETDIYQKKTLVNEAKRLIKKYEKELNAILGQDVGGAK